MDATQNEGESSAVRENFLDEDEDFKNCSADEQWCFIFQETCSLGLKPRPPGSCLDSS